VNFVQGADGFPCCRAVFPQVSRGHPVWIREASRFWRSCSVSRDEKAGQRDIPPFKILGNDAIRELGGKAAPARAGISQYGGTSPQTDGKVRPGDSRRRVEGMAPAGERSPCLSRFQRPVRDRLQEERLKRLKLWREARSREIGIDGGILANNALRKTCRKRYEH